MPNLLILLGFAEPIRNQYRDRLQQKFPELTIHVVDHRSKVGPYIAAADVLLTFTPARFTLLPHAVTVFVPKGGPATPARAEGRIAAILRVADDPLESAVRVAFAQAPCRQAGG